MGNKDIAEKHFEEINKVFADIVNGTLFGGQQTVKEEDLFDLPARSQFKADTSKLHEQERDIAKRWAKEGIVFSIIGIENQTVVDRDMVLRVISYDGASYKSQLLDENDPRRYPVVTIVLYYGKEPWNAPNSLKERINIPACIEKYVNDYHINVFDISHMTNSEIDKLFYSDFKILAQFINGIEDTSSFNQKIDYPDPLLKVLSVIANDKRFETLNGDFKEGEVSMCEILDRFEAKGEKRGEARGEARGIIKGEQKNSRKIVASLAKNGVSLDIIIASIPNLPEDEIQEIFNSIINKS